MQHFRVDKLLYTISAFSVLQFVLVPHKLINSDWLIKGLFTCSHQPLHSDAVGGVWCAAAEISVVMML